MIKVRSIIETHVLSSLTASPEEKPVTPSGDAVGSAGVPVSDPALSTDSTTPADPVTPAIQSVIDAATQAGQAAYQQVVQDSIQALSVQQSA